MSGPWRLPLGHIHDRPRFAWRGLMLDVARHFFDVGEVKRLVDVMTLYKLNRLHLHLTDDQGWRLAIRSWPRLTTHGSRTAVGGGPGGRFTQRDYAAIVRYARERFVEVVPEIDMPGHVNAALSAYGRLTCDGVAPAPYTGIEVGFSSLCIRKELTYAFVEDVVREVAALTPGPYIHVGGRRGAFDRPRRLHRLREPCAAHRAPPREANGRVGGGRAGGPVHRTTLVQHWQSDENAQRALARGAKLIMSPATKAYLDMKYTRSTALGLSWAGTTTVRDAYEWDPATQVDGVAERDVVAWRRRSGRRRSRRAPSSTTSPSRASSGTPRSDGHPPRAGRGASTGTGSPRTGRASGRSASPSTPVPRWGGGNRGLW